MFNKDKVIVQKSNLTDQIFSIFTDEVGGSHSRFGKILYDRFEVEDERFLDDYIYWSVYNYFKTKLIPHKIAVFKAGLELSRYDWFYTLKFNKNQFVENLWLHDLSKFSIQESIPYANHDFSSGKTSIEFDCAWIHHKNHNEHHPEYWLNPSKDGTLNPLPMPMIYIVEMIADWIGAGRTYGNELETWLPDNLHKFLWHEETATNVKFILEKLGFVIDRRGNVLYIGK